MAHYTLHNAAAAETRPPSVKEGQREDVCETQADRAAKVSQDDTYNRALSFLSSPHQLYPRDTGENAAPRPRPEIAPSELQTET